VSHLRGAVNLGDGLGLVWLPDLAADDPSTTTLLGIPAVNAEALAVAKVVHDLKSQLAHFVRRLVGARETARALWRPSQQAAGCVSRPATRQARSSCPVYASGIAKICPVQPSSSKVPVRVKP
jgi:hypothetical protein